MRPAWTVSSTCRCIEAEVNGIAYNGGLLSELGYDPATAAFGTWDELYALAEKAAENNWYLENLSTFNWGEFLVTVHEAGGQVYARTTAPTSNFLEQPVIDALTRWVTEYDRMAGSPWNTPSVVSMNRAASPITGVSLEQVTATQRRCSLRSRR